MDKKFRENELVIYAPECDGKIYKFQVGKFKRYAEDKEHAFIWYHAGSTAARTDIKYLYHLEGEGYLKDEFNSLD